MFGESCLSKKGLKMLCEYRFSAKSDLKVQTRIIVLFANALPLISKLNNCRYQRRVTTERTAFSEFVWDTLRKVFLSVI